ncbi:hypothetical protein [Desulfopila sp. IMCC35008]|nr:hypothetical protein [Desulfopila sp. IMCC35008]
MIELNYPIFRGRIDFDDAVTASGYYHEGFVEVAGRLQQKFIRGPVVVL